MGEKMNGTVSEWVRRSKGELASLREDEWDSEQMGEMMNGRVS